jgi:hypothetical protein
MMKRLATRGLMLLVLTQLAACDDGDGICDFSLGGEDCNGPPIQPGPSLPEGGEIRHESVRMFGQPDQAWIEVYQYAGTSPAANAPLPGPIAGSQYGTCVDERDPASATWPYKPIVGATYLELPIARITGTGILTELDLATTAPTSQVGNLTFRAQGLAYGGGAAGDPPGGFNGTLPAAAATPGGTYAIDIGQGAMTYYMPTGYVAPLGIGGADTIAIADDTDLEMSWTPPELDNGDNRQFDYTFFADPSQPFAPQFICFPDVAGHLVVPASVTDELPDTGWIVHARITHRMESADASGEMRRFDLVAAFENVSRYAKQ